MNSPRDTKGAAYHDRVACPRGWAVVERHATPFVFTPMHWSYDERLRTKAARTPSARVKARLAVLDSL